MPLEELPPLDAVLLSHDHFDHLDEPTLQRLLERCGPELRWLTPLGYREWLAERGFSRVVEMDWWEGVRLGDVRVVFLPARHWCRRGLRADERLWGSWALLPPSGPRLYFGADSGYCPAFARIGECLGPFDLSLLPIGAYAPRWFMRDAHMDPEEAVRAYLDLGGRGGFVGMHWGTFRLSDEDPLEPPRRTRAVWQEARLPPERLHLPGIGGTVTA